MLAIDAEAAGPVADSSSAAVVAAHGVAVVSEVPAFELPAFEALYRAHFDFVWRVLLRLGVPRREMDDLAQEVFKVVFVQRARYDGRASVRAWLFGIAHNVTRTWRRGVRRKGIFDPLPEALVDASAPSAERTASTQQELRALARLLETLEPEMRDVFIMTELLEMTAREIGEALELSPNTVSSRLRRAWAEVERKAARTPGRQP